MVFIPLILAHLLGDFFLQPDHWVRDKERKGARSKYLYLHVLLHMALAAVFLWNAELWNVGLWWVVLIIGISHGIIDWLKITFQKPKTKRRWFFLDQLAHLLVIAGISLGIIGWTKIKFFVTPEIITVVTGALFLLLPSSIMIKTAISGWTPTALPPEQLETDSLANAGKYIGMLERLLVYIFVLTGHWEGVGFMIAAKSVFRFSDLAQARQRKLTEYVLIGTLLSFGAAVVTALAVQYYLK